MTAGIHFPPPNPPVLGSWNTCKAIRLLSKYRRGRNNMFPRCVPSRTEVSSGAAQPHHCARIPLHHAAPGEIPLLSIKLGQIKPLSCRSALCCMGQEKKHS